MDWLVLPLAMTFCGGALGGSSGRDTLTHTQHTHRHTHSKSQRSFHKTQAKTEAAFGSLLERERAARARVRGGHFLTHVG